MNLKDVLRHRLTEEELDVLVRSYDIVGDLAIIIIPQLLEDKQHLIGQAIMEINKLVRVVLKRVGNYHGEFRQIPLEVIAGEDRKETVGSENGVKLKLNPEQAYYSVRSSGERKRVAGKVEAHEEVLVMFSGVAPFPLVIAKNSKANSVVGIEKNPAAHHYGLESLKLNKRIKNVFLYQGDVEVVLPKLGRMFDRILMPLPHNADEFLPLAFQYLSKNGWLHYYGIYKKEEFSHAIDDVANACRAGGRELDKTELNIAGHCGPGKYRVCIDCLIR